MSDDTTVGRAVNRAEIAYGAYRMAAGWGSHEEVISDMLADLMHLVDSLTLDREIGEDFDTLLQSAARNYNAEIEENA